MQVDLADLKPHRLLPPTDMYVTYEGSLTMPGCLETVTWIIPNNPIYITAEHVRDITLGGSAKYPCCSTTRG